MKSYLGDVRQKDTLLKCITLDQLKVFEAAARHSSFTRAAEELFVTQPTVSMQVKHLTQAVGVPLFEYVGKRIYLTEAGREVLSTCKEIFKSLDRLETAIVDLKGMKQGRLRLAAVTTTKYFIPKLLKPFCKLYPGVSVSLEITNHNVLLSRLNDNLDDLYILSCPPEREDMEAKPFLDNPLVLVAPCDHPLALKRNISLKYLTNEPFIMREQGSGTRKVVENFFAQHQISVPINLELGSNEAIQQAVIDGLGLSVLSLHTLNSTEKINKLAILDVEGFPIYRQWHIAYPKKKQLSITASTFLEYLLLQSQKFYVDQKNPLEIIKALQAMSLLTTSKVKG
ncbi:MAG: LysR family transcriptional regulator [Richelia sp. RM2_1_2]|nr:LysR family transcriptional regulator [Richelia sp. SM2_1_7]NJM21843.1 LysR family transcriptional regulator [Richelia sp. SM1_7_0]NJN10594.1 LysR family transcriptional regulator [Richelia sp. RM1_1_1]NJO31157.1 LysR family transcriptional regulator [Richelia sp. SL_2_1]NJO57227.1 LysR family transcriptional regulator [Richelia sp. RM2_1_2]